MKTGRTAGPSGIVIEMIRSAGQEIIKSITNLVNRIIKEGALLQIATFCILLSVYARVKAILSLETITEV